MSLSRHRGADKETSRSILRVSTKRADTAPISAGSTHLAASLRSGGTGMAMSLREAVRNRDMADTVHGSCKVVRTFFAIARMVSTMAAKNSAIFAAHGTMTRSSAALWQGVLVM